MTQRLIAIHEHRVIYGRLRLGFHRDWLLEEYDPETGEVLAELAFQPPSGFMPTQDQRVRVDSARRITPLE